MADTKRTLSALVSILADNTTRDISAQDLRDFLVSIMGSNQVATLSTNTTLGNDHDVVLVNAGSGSVTVTLPDATTASLKNFKIKRIDSSSTNFVKIAAAGSNTIDGDASAFLLTLNQSIEIVSDGSNWKVISGGYREGEVKIWEQTANASLPASPATTSVLSTGIGNLTIPANFWAIGTALRFEAYGRVVNAANTFDVQTRLSIGSTNVDSVVVTNSNFWASGALLKIEADVVCRTIGATGTFSVKTRLEVANNLVVETNSNTLAVVDTTVSNLFNFSIKTVTSNFDSGDVTNARVLVSK